MEQKPPFWKKIRTVLSKPNVVLGAYILITIVASIAELAKGASLTEGHLYTHYNNYIIFKQSFFHLLGNQDLYVLYPNEQWDLYKYSPTFSVFMGLLAYLPDYVGLIVWNLINSLTLFFAIRQLPIANEKIKVAMLWFVLQETLTSIQNSQSNALMAGLIIVAFNFLERKNMLLASLCIVLTVYIKIFGLVAFALFLLYPRKLAFIAYSAGWVVVLGLFPLLFISIDQLQFLYQSWINMLAADHSASLGLSVMGWLDSWFHLPVSKNIVVLIGALLFCLPLLKWKSYSDPLFRLLMLASVLLWIIIFNHKAESPTFVLAISGVAVWYFSQERRTENLVLLCLAFVFTSLSPTDLFPAYLREHLVFPYVLKAVPCILIWFKLIYDMLFNQPESNKILSPAL
ncbi:MAG: glycosyltransferase family 87 protein [Bacteroidota bacterium]